VILSSLLTVATPYRGEGDVLVDVCDVTHPYVCHDSFIRVPWLIHTCAMTYSRWELIFDDACPADIKNSCFFGAWFSVMRIGFMCAMTHSYVCHDPFICVPWLIHMCAWLIHMCAWLIHTFAMTHSWWELISDVALVPQMPEIRDVCAERINFEEILERMVWIDENWFSWQFDENWFEVISIENWFEVWIDENYLSLWSLW